MWKPSRGGNRGGSTSPSRVTLIGQRPLNSDPASLHGSPPGKRVAGSGDSEELTGLQACIQKLVDKKLKLVNVVQVMLIRQILPCQRRGFNMWEFDPAQHQTLSGLFDTTYEDVWKVLFKAPRLPHPLPKIADSARSVRLTR